MQITSYYLTVDSSSLSTKIYYENNHFGEEHPHSNLLSFSIFSKESGKVITKDVFPFRLSNEKIRECTYYAISPHVLRKCSEMCVFQQLPFNFQRDSAVDKMLNSCFSFQNKHGGKMRTTKYQICFQIS